VENVDVHLYNFFVHVAS